MNYSTECIVLKRKNFAEADRIITVYSNDFGKLTLIAKGVRRPRSKKVGHLEPGSWCKIHVAKGKNLDLITEIESKKSFGTENFSTGKANKIYHLLEVIDTLTVPGQKNKDVFTTLLSFIKAIDETSDFNLISTTFKLKLLRQLGFFAANNIQNDNIRNAFSLIESNTNQQKNSQKISQDSYLKLIMFLDSIIERVSESKLKTNRFINGNF